jgi:hypothetical protein
MPQMAWKDAIIHVLSNADDSMHYADIADEIAARGLRKDIGATPANTVATIISTSIQNEQDDSPFVRVARGQYSLRHPGKHSVEEAVEPIIERDIEEAGLINAFGMYWWRDKVLWASATPKLLGQQQAKAASVDFANQKGVYLLHDRRDVVYVGRATDQSLGLRLKQHTFDRLNGRWDRFSWFGIHPVSDEGIVTDDSPGSFTVDTLIITMEALLIEGLEPPQNRKRGDDFRAVEFLQVEDPTIGKNQIMQVIEELKSKL